MPILISHPVYQFAGLAIPTEVDGRSLVSLLRGQGNWRDDLLIESFERSAPYAAIHTGQYVYIETKGDRSELYDLEKDPHQLENRINDPAYAQIMAEMKKRLKPLGP